MRDVELYRAILGLKAPWTVTSVGVGDEIDEDLVERGGRSFA